jgi:hypothetical protein
MSETWKPVVGYEEFYSVSNWGRVQSHNRVDGKNRPRVGRMLALFGERYHSVLLSSRGERKFRKVHQLVLQAFVGPAPDGYEGCHNDGNAFNNNLANLRWDTRANNAADAYAHGTRKTTLTPDDVREIRRRVSDGQTQADVAREFHVVPSAVSGIVARKTRKRVDDE